MVDESLTQQSVPAEHNQGFPRLRRLLVFLCLAFIGVSLYSVLKTVFSPESSGEGASRTSHVGAQVLAEKSFDLDQTTLPRKEILIGNPVKDAIPTLSSPEFVSASSAGQTFLKAGDQVVGLRIGQEARAYPLKILIWHEAVNDRFGETPIAVTYCPLCQSVAAFDRSAANGEVEFGVSGLLYNSNVLFFNRNEKEGQQSLFSQLKGEGVSNELQDKALSQLPVELTTWNDWKLRYPKTKVLSVETGHNRDYNQPAYERYFANDKLMFPAQPADNRYPNKTLVLGVASGDKVKAYAYPEYAQLEKVTKFEESLDGKSFTLVWNPTAKSLRVEAADEGVTWMYSFWFAWYAFHPETAIHEGNVSQDAN